LIHDFLKSDDVLSESHVAGTSDPIESDPIRFIMVLGLPPIKDLALCLSNPSTEPRDIPKMKIMVQGTRKYMRLGNLLK